MRLRPLPILLAAAAAALLAAAPAFGSDHRDSPGVRDTPKVDIAGLYAFPGESAGSAVLVMTVNPFTIPGDTGRLSLDPAANYEFKIDTTGDAVPEVAYKFEFTGDGAVQDVTIRRAYGPDAITNDRSGTIVATGRSSTGAGVTIISGGGLKAYAGPRDDPFFFDLTGFQAGLKFNGVDTFRSTNVTAIVLELPAPATKFGAWAATSKVNTFGNFDQVDRAGMAGINLLFIPGAKKELYNIASPDRDRSLFGADIKATLDAMKSPAAETLAAQLVPDVLTCDLAKPVVYFNCRGLTDDVMDITLTAALGAPTSDRVDRNEVNFLRGFPYLAPPNGSGVSAAPLPPDTGTGAAGSAGSAPLRLAGVVAAGLLFAGALGVVARRGKGAFRQ